MDKEFCSLLTGVIIVIFVMLLLVSIYVTKFRENMTMVEGGERRTDVGYNALVKNAPEYTAVPKLATSIGGRKGTAYYNSHGMYDADVKHAQTGTPNRSKYQRTLLKPSSIGFSHNSLVNRNTYSDFYNNVNERLKSPSFRYITRFGGLSLNPARYSLPLYRYAMI